MKHSLDVVVRELVSADEAGWLRLRRQLWPESNSEDGLAWTARRDVATLVAESAHGRRLVGFVEVGSRAYADGCDSSPVAFLEGWYVNPADRGKGAGRALIRAAILWAQARGLRELASDSLLQDMDAYTAHLSVGFQEVERSIKYRLVLE